jgi:O-antigen/teichoic acid export membrane protein
MSLKKNTLWNLIGVAVPVSVGLALTPTVWNSLGPDRFGILTLIWALVGYLSLFDLGTGRALTYEVRLLIDGRTYKTDDLVITCLAGVATAVLVGSFGFIAMYVVAENLPRWVNMSQIFLDDAKASLVLCAFAVIPTTIGAAQRGILEGAGRFGLSNAIKIFTGTVLFAAPFIAAVSNIDRALALTAEILLYSRIFAVVVLFCFFAIKYRGLNKAAKIKASSMFENILGKSKSMLGYGSWVTVTGVVGPIMVFGDRFFVSTFVGTEALAYYAVCQEFIVRLLVIPNAFFGALLPELVGSDKARIEKKYQRAFRLNLVAMASFCGLSSLAAYPAMTLWMGADFADRSLAITFILVLGVFFNSLAQAPYTLCLARGRPDLVAKLHALELALYIPALYFLLHWFGIIGAAVAWSVRALCDFLALSILSQNQIRTG